MDKIFKKILEKDLEQAYSDWFLYGGVVMNNGRVVPMETYIQQTGTPEENKIVGITKLYNSKPFS